MHDEWLQKKTRNTHVQYKKLRDDVFGWLSRKYEVTFSNIRIEILSSNTTDKSIERVFVDGRFVGNFWLKGFSYGWTPAKLLNE